MPLTAFDILDKAIQNWCAQLSWPAEQVLRLLLATFAGGLVGIEREIRGRQAGFRTNVLVCVGSALVMLVSIAFATRPWPHEAGINLNIDPARIAYGIMTGIGFLGAGTILKHGASVHGLTTAAAMWCVAAIGMAAGFGMYSLTVITTVIVVVVLWLLDILALGIPKIRYRVLVVRRPWAPGCMAETVKRMKDAKMRVDDASFERTQDMAFADISVRVSFKDRRLYYALERELESDPKYELLAVREE